MNAGQSMRGGSAAEAVRTIRSREDLLAVTAEGIRVKYLHFWRHQPAVAGEVDGGCFSQWYPSPFTVEGVEYATAEHWMMAEKARLFGDPQAERAAVTARHPADAQKAGRLVRGFDEEVWARERFGIVVAGSTHKFAAHPRLGEFLRGTGERVLVEASPVDRIWGIGLAEDDERAGDPTRWRGLNLLGFALMACRPHVGH
ncbi:NADAR family protein [Streptomyces uncialis]|uniref:NADAR family protein n=1 Tax=Streptomyces uncialis TaxID=1048205 RepID=UPI0037F20E22